MGTYNGLLEQHNEGLAEVLLEERTHMNRGFINGGVDSPVLCLVPQLRRLALHQDRRERLRNGEQGQNTKCRREYQRDPRGPPPTQMALGDESSSDRASNRANEGRAGKHGGGCSTIKHVPEVNVRPTDDGDRRGAEAAGEEAGQHDGLDVLGDGEGYLEDGEDGEADEEWSFAAVDLGERSPEEGT